MATETHFVTSMFGAGTPARSFWFRLVDNLCRRWPLYLVPLLAFGALGVMRTQRTVDEYESRASLSVSTNPLVDQFSVRGTNIYNWETPSSGTVRIMYEQMSTDSFAERVTRGAGLGDEYDAGLITLDVVRAHLSFVSLGDTLIGVGATAIDPDTAYRLVNATVEAYSAFVSETEVADSAAAVEFYEDLADEAELASQQAQEDLDAYLRAHPEPAGDADRPIEETLQIQRLNNALDNAEQRVDSALTAIRDAELQVIQANSEAGRRIRMVDPPTRATEPVSTTSANILTMGVFVVIGVFVSALAAVVSTLLDKSVRLTDDVVAATGLPVVATIPVVATLKRRGGGRRSVAAIGRRSEAA